MTSEDIKYRLEFLLECNQQIEDAEAEMHHILKLAQAGDPSITTQVIDESEKRILSKISDVMRALKDF